MLQFSTLSVQLFLFLLLLLRQLALVQVQPEPLLLVGLLDAGEEGLAGGAPGGGGGRATAHLREAHVHSLERNGEN